ncbi:MAG: phage Gp37/Gp68 family protein [Acidobacteriia bacterium]|nr:phage Gp37/Gp68 family protein [Terriglobia bacterium]
MGEKTKIEWTDATWNPIRGCSRVSEGCRNCYAESIAARFSGTGRPYEGLAEFKGGDARWTGEVRLIEKHLEDPLHWKEPQRIFVNSMSDLFHPGVKLEWLADIFGVMARAPQHTYQILTKRPDRMLDALRAGSVPDVALAFEQTYGQSWPPANWWFGVSVEDQGTANRLLPILARCPAAVRFVSYEPAIGPVDFFAAMDCNLAAVAEFDWIICGGESCPHARPMDPAWPRSVRNLCSDLGIPFFMKQMGGQCGHNDVPIPEDLAIKEFPQGLNG